MNAFIANRQYFFTAWLLVFSNAFTASVVWYNSQCSYVLQNDAQHYDNPSLSRHDLEKIVLYHTNQEAPDHSIERTVAAIRTKCALPKLDMTNGEITWFEALLNINERSVCICETQTHELSKLLLARNRTVWNTQTQGHSEILNIDKQSPDSTSKIETLKRSRDTGNLRRNDPDLPTLYLITPTYARLTQKSDLTSMCHTLMLVPNLTWILVEDGTEETELVTKLLERCEVKSVHLIAQTPLIFRRFPSLNFSRGVRQRNAGLDWVRKDCKRGNCKGVVYFADDDNKYDLRLFEELRKTVNVSVLPVAFSGGLMFEGPKCVNGVAVEWHAAWATERNFSVDMAGFAVNIDKLLQYPGAKIGYASQHVLIPGVKPIRGYRAPKGFLESVFIMELGATKQNVECRGIPNEVLVWHVKTEKPTLVLEKDHPSDPTMEV